MRGKYGFLIREGSEVLIRKGSRFLICEGSEVF